MQRQHANAVPALQPIKPSYACHCGNFVDSWHKKQL